MNEKDKKDQRRDYQRKYLTYAKELDILTPCLCLVLNKVKIVSLVLDIKIFIEDQYMV